MHLGDFSNRNPLSLRMDLMHDLIDIPEQFENILRPLKEWEQDTIERAPVDILTDVSRYLQHHAQEFASLDSTGLYHCINAAHVSRKLSVLIFVSIDNSVQFDLGKLILDASRELYVSCTNEGDIVLAGLMICHAMQWVEADHARATHNTKPSWNHHEGLFRRSLDRHLDGKSLIICTDHTVNLLEEIENNTVRLKSRGFLDEKAFRFVENFGGDASE